jgi:hypothetical protein
VESHCIVISPVLGVPWFKLLGEESPQYCMSVCTQIRNSHVPGQRLRRSDVYLRASLLRYEWELSHLHTQSCYFFEAYIEHGT